jgi:hypothetical protein
MWEVRLDCAQDVHSACPANKIEKFRFFSLTEPESLFSVHHQQVLQRDSAMHELSAVQQPELFWSLRAFLVYPSKT